MKKKWAVVVIALILLAALVAGCGEKKIKADVYGEPRANDTVRAAENWREKIVTGSFKTTGEGVTVDGAFSDGEWEGVYPMKYSDAEVEVELFSRFGADGLYVAYRITDDEFYYHPKREDYCNSGVDLYLSEAGVEALDYSVLQIRCDTVGTVMTYSGLDASLGQHYRWTQKYLPVFGFTAVTGGLSGNDDEGYAGAGVMTVEMFVAWEAFGLDGAPEAIKMFPHYNYINSSMESARRVDSVEPFGGYDEPRSWYAFDESGYVNSDARIAQEIGSDGLVVGDGRLGLAKSAAWDLSEIGEGVVRTANAHDKHYLFFTGVCAEDYMIEVSVRHDSAAYGDPLPRTGLVTAMTNATKSSLVKNYAAFILGCGKEQLGTVRTFEEPGWVMSPDHSLSGIPGNTDPAAGFVKLTVAKLGASFHYFVNDTYMTSIGSRELPQFEGETVPGLFTIGSNSTFKDFKVVSDTAAVRAALGEYGLNVITIDSGEGGSVTARAGVSSFRSIGAVMDGQSVTFDLRPTLNRNVMYLVRSIRVGGAERLADVKDGALTVDDVRGELAVEVEFARAENTVRVEGRAYTTDLSQPLTVMRLTNITDKSVVDVYEYNGLRAETDTLAIFNFVLNDGVYRLRLGNDSAFLRVETGAYTVIDGSGKPLGDGKTIFLSA